MIVLDDPALPPRFMFGVGTARGVAGDGMLKYPRRLGIVGAEVPFVLCHALPDPFSTNLNILFDNS